MNVLGHLDPACDTAEVIEFADSSGLVQKLQVEVCAICLKTSCLTLSELCSARSVVQQAEV